MGEGLLVAVTRNPEGKVLDNGRRRLPVDGVALGEGVLEHANDSIEVVLGHLADVLEDEGERFEATVADVELGAR
jgi:hypothetical protein